MTSVNKQSNAKDTKADEVCINKCPNKKTHSQQNDTVLHFQSTREYPRGPLFWDSVVVISDSFVTIIRAMFEYFTSCNKRV